MTVSSSVASIERVDLPMRGPLPRLFRELI